MNARRIPSLLLSSMLAMSASACIITTTDDDDSAGDAGSGDGSGDDAGTGDGADETAEGEGGAAEAPEAGRWIYAETGETSNDCNFLEDPSNGWGEYDVELISGGFRVTPGDDTEPFDCTAGGGAFQCPERLQEEITEGSTTLRVFVTIEGTLPSADSMAGTQDGEVVCEGGDCALAEQLLETTFPCTFSIGFTGEHVG